MFEAAELGTRIPKDDYKARAPIVRRALLDAQQALRASAGFSAIVILGGVEAAGRSETANVLNEWMDPRWLVTRAWAEPSDEERERPPFWRYWRTLPARGRIGVFLHAWYAPAFHARVVGRCRKGEFEARLARIAAFEQALVDDGTVIIKFFLHLAAKLQRKRLKALQRNPLTRWRVTEEQWEALRAYSRVKAAAEEAIRRTSTDAAPWHIVEGADERYRHLTVASLLREAIELGLERSRLHRAIRRRAMRPRAQGPRADAVLEKAARQFNVLSALDLTKVVAKGRFAEELEKQQGRLNWLQRRALQNGVTTIALFEGWDAAGKGGAIRRVTAALDARHYQVIPIGAPTDEELAQHYLWRFWRHLSRAGRITIFDRSWYGRVLVERVERLATLDEYRRAYGEINQFEDQLVEHGIVLNKFWLHISKAEQLKRFRDRERKPHKRWKITEDDWRNRRKWDEYEVAVNEMVARTSTQRAPWLLVEANDKNYARIKVIQTLADRLEQVLE